MGISELNFNISYLIENLIDIALPFVLGTIQAIYGLIAVVAVFRSSKRYHGSLIWTHLAKATITALVIIIIFLNLQALFQEMKSVANQGPVRLP